MPCLFAAFTASVTSCGVVSQSAAKMPPVWNQRTPSLPKMWSQSKSPGLSWLGGGVAAIGNADRAAHAEAALGEVQAIARLAADAVELPPFDELGIDAALHDEIFDQAADVVVGEGGGDGGLQAEAAAQAARDVVFAAAFPDFEFARGADAALAGIEAEHDFAEREHVVSTGPSRFDIQRSHVRFSLIKFERARLLKRILKLKQKHGAWGCPQRARMDDASPRRAEDSAPYHPRYSHGMEK